MSSQFRRAVIGTLLVGLAGCISEDDTDEAPRQSDDDPASETDDESNDVDDESSGPGSDADETTPTDNDTVSHPAELGSPLPDLLEAEDPKAVAESREIPYDDELDAIAVVITTESDRGVPAELVVSTGVSTDTDRGVATGVTVSPDKLRSLAEHRNVTQVRPAGVPEDD